VTPLLSICVAVAVLAVVALLAWHQFGAGEERVVAPARAAGAPIGWKWGDDAREQEARRAFGPDPASFAARGRFAARAGGSYAVGQARLADPAGECVAVVGPGGDAGTACSEPRLFSSGPVVWVEGFEGGPAPAARTSEYVAGLAADSVKRIDLVQSDGVSRSTSLSAGNAFFVELDPVDLARGVYVDHLEARGQNGRLVSRIALNDAG
jgi:hypothetical protein